ncbi:hypothetical protein PR048_013008 [Dryococelus australis]|uniref:Titin n=1 Tax=Dryococelus australis TaxID=614101 RepID=A0ABQ9HR38_9NEOP|nr:hypothetical protein PR048_013008 [Dryococelus australis]
MSVLRTLKDHSVAREPLGLKSSPVFHMFALEFCRMWGVPPDISHLEFYDDHVQEGHQYEYRVTAVNAAGSGKPSDTSAAISAKPMKEKPKLYLDGLYGKKIKVRAGEPINIQIPLSGAPIPTVDWTRNSSKLPESNRISRQNVRVEETRNPLENPLTRGIVRHDSLMRIYGVDPAGDRTRFVLVEGEQANSSANAAPVQMRMDTVSDSATLRIEATTRNDSGKYTITAKNDYGKDSADIEVTVVDKPGSPKGPLSYSNVSQDSVTLSWNPPQDDGGGDITGYVIEMAEFGQDNWRTVPGYCPKPNFTVKSLHEGKRYVFRVRAENIYGLSEPLEGKPVAAKCPFDPPDAPSQPEVTSYSPTNCNLRWNPPTETGGKPITGYYVEKRERGGEWIKVNNYPTPNTSFNVQDLREGSRYEFRVIAVNEAGPGKPSKPTDSITAEYQRSKCTFLVFNLCLRYKYLCLTNKFTYSYTFTNMLHRVIFVQNRKPDAPEPPKADRITKDSVTLSWRPPRHDGGAKIKGYIIQKKKKGDSDWSDVNSSPVPVNVYKVPDLKEGEEYQFRILAVNDVGPSEPSRPSNNILIEEQANKPCMDLGAMRDITVRAGEDFSIHVPYVAFPKPVLTWFNNDTLLDDKDPRVFQQLTDDAASIVVKNSKRSDGGQYRLQLRNNAGFDTATVNVRVLDRPGPPENLRADEFSGDALTLFWNPPKDNGGADITNYVVEKKEPRSPTWSKVSSYITTPFCRIRNLVIGREYDFRVMAENQYGTSEPATLAEPVRARHPFDPPGAPGAPRGIDSSEDSITIAWTKPRHDGGSPITGYVVEKRLISEDKWTKASHVHILDLVYKVPGLIENHEYEFRVAAINAAGQGPWSSSSDSIFCRPPPSAPKITSDLSIRDMTVIAGEEFTITVPFTGNPQPKPSWTINGEDVYPGDRIKFETSNTATVFINKCARRTDLGTYTIHLVNSEGSDTASCKVLVVDKPLPPQGPLDVSDITPETCSLSWRAPLDDGGSPITNYVVEKLDPSSGLWVKVSSFVRSTHYDVIGLEPNRKYSFRIRAENQYGVSDPLELDEPITAKFAFTVPDPPGQPRISDWDTTDITLTWDRPRSDGGARIQGYKIEYRDVSEAEWRVANDYLVKDTTHNVHSLLQGREYEFRVRAKNAAGFSKPSPPSSKLKLKSKSNVPSPPGTPKVIKVGRSYVDLQWEPPVSDGGSRITGYIVEKRESGAGTWVKCNEYNVLDCSYTVLNLVEQADYEFRIFAVNAVGKSEPSSCTTPVKICEIEGGEKPEFVRPLSNVGAPLGAPVVLECEASGKPKPTARWLKNGRELTLGGRFYTEQKNGVFKLTISEVMGIDDGDYVCEASNSLGYVTTSARVRIGAPPRIDRMPGDLYLPEGDNTKIKIYYSGDQPMEVTLSKDGKKIDESTHIKYTVFDEYLIIFIKEITKTDAGVYTLSVKNDSGSVSASFTVYITGLPGPPIGPLDVSDISKNTCTLNWKPPKYDGGLRITHYVVERRDITSTHWIIVSSFCKETVFTVQGLTEGQEYLFRIMAVNDNGMGPPLEGTNPIKAKAPFDPPSPPGTPKVTEVGGDFVNLQWDKPESDGGTKIQGYWIDKREAGSETWQRVNVAICMPTQINISNLIEGRQYEFRVFAQNVAGISEPSTASTSVKIKDPQAAKPPEIVKPLRNVNAIQNHNAEFQCTITGYKGARELTQGTKYQMLKEGDIYSLVVNDIYGEDADEYVCRAANKAGVKSTRAELVIMTAPRLSIPPRFHDTAFFDKGENVVVKIPFTGFPKPKISWMKDGETIESGGHYTVERKVQYYKHALSSV